MRALNIKALVVASVTPMTDSDEAYSRCLTEGYQAVIGSIYGFDWVGNNQVASA